MDHHAIAEVVIGRLVDGASVVLLLCHLATLSPPIKPPKKNLSSRMALQASQAVSLFLGLPAQVSQHLSMSATQHNSELQTRQNRLQAEARNVILVTTGFESVVTRVSACDRFALGAAGKLASIALEELSKPGKVEGGSSNRTADNMSAPQPSRCTLFLVLCSYYNYCCNYHHHYCYSIVIILTLVVIFTASRLTAFVVPTTFDIIIGVIPVADRRCCCCVYCLFISVILLLLRGLIDILRG